MCIWLTYTRGIIGGALRLALYIHRTYIAHPGSDQSVASIAQDVIISYVEPGMYLIAACLPSLRSLIKQLNTTLNDSIASLVHWGRSFSRGASGGDLEGSPDRANSPPKKESTVPKIDVKLTDQGALTSLARAGHEFTVSSK